MGKHILDNTVFESDGDIIDRIVTEQTESIPIDTIVEQYHKSIYSHKKSVQQLLSIRIGKELISRYKIGYADGSLLNKLSDKQKKYLTDLGLLLDGQEVLHKLFTVPIYSKTKLISIFGFNSSLELVNSIHLQDEQPVFNQKVLKVYDEIIVTDNIITCLQFISCGIKNVVSTPIDIYVLKLFHDYRVKTIGVLSDIYKEQLFSNGFAVKILSTDDWNTYLLSVEPQALSLLIETSEIIYPQVIEQNIEVHKTELKHIFTIGEIIYNVIGVKDIFISSLKVHISAMYKGEKFPDNVDLYSARSRNAFSTTVSSLFCFEQRKIEKDLIAIIDYLELERDKHLVTPDIQLIELTPEEKRIGKEFLKSTDIFEQIIDDLNTIGFVGEELNKTLLYLVATSRKMDSPLSIIIISQSGSGKSFLVSSVKKLIPEEDVVSITSLSDQALIYTKDDNLLYKFLILGEAVHSEKVEHLVREMLSEKELSRLVTYKDDRTGDFITKQVTTKVVVASVLSTTNNSVNPENASRCFIINTDESIEQTKRIHSIQRKKYSLERHKIKTEIVPDIIKKHISAQRLLRKIMIVNPFAENLIFPDSTMRSRRDNERFIDLIASVCFLRQYQKEIQYDGTLEYILCDLKDYEVAYNVMVNGVLSSTLIELPRGAFILYESIRHMVESMAQEKDLSPTEVTFIQRDIREYTKTGADSIRKYIHQLVLHEYLQVIGGKNRGVRYCYKLRLDAPIEELDKDVIPSPDEMQKLQKVRKG